MAMKRICVTGGAGFLGRAVCKALAAKGETRVLVPRSAMYDLTLRGEAEALLRCESEIIIHLAATCGGIGANKAEPGRFFYDNMAMGLNMIEEARIRNVERFVLVGTVCSYPKHCPVPFREEDLWNGYPEETNAPYGVAKRALGTMLDAYRAQYGFNGVYLLPANLYGPGDNFDPQTSHVIPAMIRKFCKAVDDKAESVTLWGTGKPTREFLYVDDAGEAIAMAALTCDEPGPINLGAAHNATVAGRMAGAEAEVSIADVAKIIAGLCGFKGSIGWAGHWIDGQPRRVLDSRRAWEVLGWIPQVRLNDGLRRTIEWWREHDHLQVR
jgi:GDP-L-fucose synthase